MLAFIATNKFATVEEMMFLISNNKTVLLDKDKAIFPFADTHGLPKPANKSHYSVSLITSEIYAPVIWEDHN